MDRNRRSQLTNFLTLNKITYNSLELFNESFTHSSWINEQQEPQKDNQRLEYLGDSVLGLVINQILFDKYPHFDEGQLSQIKATVVAEEALSQVAQILNIGDMLLLGKGELGTGGKSRSSNQADALEALIAAIYLDQGLTNASIFVACHFKALLEQQQNPEQARDHKTILQEIMQSKGQGLPEYKVLKSIGPDHEKVFEVAVSLRGQEMARAQGLSIKKAQMAAAKLALTEHYKY